VLCRQCFQTKQRAAASATATAATTAATAELVAAAVTADLGTMSQKLLTAAAQAPQA
jgi:hypothetical protein